LVGHVVGTCWLKEWLAAIGYEDGVQKRDKEAAKEEGGRKKRGSSNVQWLARLDDGDDRDEKERLEGVKIV
jgi:hypothetical protein